MVGVWWRHQHFHAPASLPGWGLSRQAPTWRTVPDVAMDADPSTGVPIYDTYDWLTANPWTQAGGTSLATPLWAGVMAVVDQGRVLYGEQPLDGATGTDTGTL